MQKAHSYESAIQTKNSNMYKLSNYFRATLYIFQNIRDKTLRVKLVPLPCPGMFRNFPKSCDFPKAFSPNPCSSTAKEQHEQISDFVSIIDRHLFINVQYLDEQSR